MHAANAAQQVVDIAKGARAGDIGEQVSIGIVAVGMAPPVGIGEGGESPQVVVALVTLWPLCVALSVTTTEVGSLSTL